MRGGGVVGRFCDHLVTAREVDARCLVCGYYREEKESWWNEGCELREINAVGAVCACKHLTVFSLLLTEFIRTLMCSHLDILESVERWLGSK